MSTTEWQPIKAPYHQYQRLYMFAEVGPTSDGRWNWSVIATSKNGRRSLLADGVTDTEEAAKSAATSWTKDRG